ncbi:hypothetical protein OH492_13880 [Vibrio chagasii]|nr:hypothetical protein [Vibrio chagasii]
MTRVLDEVVKNIEAAGENFNPSDIAGGINRDHASPLMTLILKIKLKNEANKGSKKADLAKLIKTDGINWFGGADEGKYRLSGRLWDTKRIPIIQSAKSATSMTTFARTVC